MFSTHPKELLYLPTSGMAGVHISYVGLTDTNKHLRANEKQKFDIFQQLLR